MINEETDMNTKLQIRVEELTVENNRMKIDLAELKQEIGSLELEMKRKDATISEAKAQKKLIFELKQDRDEKLANIKINSTSIEEYKTKLEETKSALKSKVQVVNVLTKEKEELTSKL